MERDGAQDRVEQTVGFDETLARIEAIVERLEAGNLTLEESLRLFEEGMDLVRRADETLKEAEMRIEKLVSGRSREALDESEFIEA